MSVTLNQQGFYFYQLFQCFSFYASPFLFTAFTWQKSTRVCEIADVRHPAAFPLRAGVKVQSHAHNGPTAGPRRSRWRKHEPRTHYSCLAAVRGHVWWHGWCRWSKSHLVSTLTNVTCAIRTVDCAAVLQHVPFPPTRLLFRCGPDADHQLCSPPYSAARLINDSCQRRCQSIGYSFWVCLGVGD